MKKNLKGHVMSSFRNKLLRTASALALVVPVLSLPCAAAERAPAPQMIVSPLPAPLAKDEGKQGFDVNEVVTAIEALGGVKVVDTESLPDGNQFWAFDMLGRTFTMATHGGKTLAKNLEFTAVFSDGGKIDRASRLAQANRFNLAHRFIFAAVMDGEPDVALEFDVLSSGAVRPQEVARLVRDLFIPAVLEYQSMPL